MSVLLVVGTGQYTGTQTLVNNELNTLNASGVSLLIAGDRSLPGNWALQWAQTNGVPWLYPGVSYKAIGYNGFQEPVAAFRSFNPAWLLTIGTDAHTNAATGYASVVSGNTSIFSI